MKHIRKFNESEQTDFINKEDMRKLEYVGMDASSFVTDIEELIYQIEDEELVENDSLKTMVSELIEFGSKLQEVSEKLFHYLEMENNLKADQ